MNDILKQMIKIVVGKISNGPEEYIKLLSFISNGNLYKLTYTSQYSLYFQKPEATIIADFNTWSKINNPVKRGKKAALIDSEEFFAPYVFDYEDTIKDRVPYTWNLREVEEIFNQNNSLIFFGKEVNNNFSEKTKNLLLELTRTYVRDIVKVENNLLIIKIGEGYSKIAIENDLHDDFIKLVEYSVQKVVLLRSNLELDTLDQDIKKYYLNIMEHFTREEREKVVENLGFFISYPSKILCEQISREINLLKEERGVEYVRNQVQGNRERNLNTRHNTSDDGEASTSESNKNRADENGLHERESDSSIRALSEIGTNVDVHSGDGTGIIGQNEGDNGFSHGNTEENGEFSGGREIEEPGGNNGLGNRNQGDYRETGIDEYGQLELPFITSEELEEKEKIENIPTISRNKDTYFEETWVTKEHLPQELLEGAILHGSGTAGGKERIYEFFVNATDKKARETFLKKEYYWYGMGSPRIEYGIHGLDSNPGKGFTIKWIDKRGNDLNTRLKWSEVVDVIDYMIKAEKYYFPREIDPLENIEETISSFDIESIDEEIESNPTEKIVTEELITKPKEKGKNFYYPEEWEVEKGQKTKYKNNIAAIVLLKKLEQEDRVASYEEQLILAKYSGFGGIPSAFNENAKGWENEYKELTELLTDKEYKEARASVNTSFYTSKDIVNGIYYALEKFGFQGGNILEPAMGVGNFFSAMPDNLKEKTRCYGVEIDSLTGRISKLLHPEDKIYVKGYEETTFEDNFFDVVIGNVPFGDFSPYDPKYKNYNLKIHDYFFAKALDHVRVGGVIAFVTSKGTLDKLNSKFREYLSQRAELLGCVRLPNTAFKDSANTEVTSDIIFLKKRSALSIEKPDWVHIGENEEGIPINNYYISNPQMMLGKMIFDNSVYGENSKYTALINEDENFNLKEAILEKIDFIEGKIENEIAEEIAENEEEEIHSIEAIENVKNYTYTIYDDKLYYRENSIMTEVIHDKAERIKELCKIKAVLKNLIDVQVKGSSKDIVESAQKELNTIYDSFVKKYGAINSNTNIAVFRADVENSLLSSLEIKQDDETYEKAEIFTKQTINPVIEITTVDTPVEALNLSIAEKNCVDLEYIAKLLKSVPEDVIEGLKGQIYLNPILYDKNDILKGWETAEEYLSGNVRKKLKIAEEFFEENPDLFLENIKALRSVQPKDLEAHEISVRLGTSWIDLEDYQKFAYELLGTSRAYQMQENDRDTSYKVKIELEKSTMYYFISNKALVNKSVLATQSYGSNRMDAYSILEACLNQKAIVVRDKIEEDGKERYVINNKETIIAKDKGELIKEAFKNWIFEDVDRREKYVKYYNETFNSYRLRTYDGSYLTFPGKNSTVDLKSHQKDAVARIIRGGNALLAHCVGAGKSFEMIAAAMELKRMGIANKPMIVVPNHLTSQMASEFYRLYPTSNVLLTTKYDFEKNRRRKFISKIAMGNYDAVIIGHSQFEKIPISKERRESIIQKQIDEVIEYIEMNKSEKKQNWSVKQMEAERKRLESSLKELQNESYKDDVINFEELGVDCIMVDEAHEFKNLKTYTKISGVAGINTLGSKKAMDLYMKKQYIEEITGGRNVIFATGTPISNTMGEMYIMQKYLQENTLLERGLNCFDAWAANFGEVITSLELAPEGQGYRFKNRFAKFTNLPELMSMFKEVADIQLPSMLDLDVPKLKDDRYSIIESEPNQYVKMKMDEFVERANRIRNGNVDPSEDNMLKITNEAKLLGTDARLLETDAEVDESSKLYQCVENVMDTYHNTHDIKGTQIVFCDIGTPTGKKEFNVYNFIKNRLVQNGMPEKEIVFIHDAKTDKAKDDMFKKITNGVIRVIIGSTGKMGTGTNIQKRLVALHAIDVPWRPSDVEQREGRIIRQGNLNKEVEIFRYVTKGTFDAYNWGIIENKQKFISQIMTKDVNSRDCEDIDESVLSYAEIKAIATGNPLIKEKMEVDNDVTKLKLIESNFKSQKYQLQDRIIKFLPQKIKGTTDMLEAIKKDYKTVMEYDSVVTEDGFEMTIQGQLIQERVKAGLVIHEILDRTDVKIPKEIGTYKGLKLFVEKSTSFISSGLVKEAYLKGYQTYKTELASSEAGNIIRIENLCSEQQFMNTINRLEVKKSSLEKDLEDAKKEYEKPFPYQNDLDDKLRRQRELNQQLYLIEEEKEEEKRREELQKHNPMEKIL